MNDDSIVHVDIAGDSVTATLSGVVDTVWREGGKLFISYTKRPPSIVDLLDSLGDGTTNRWLEASRELLAIRPTFSVSLEVPPIEYEPKVGDALTIVANEETIIKWRLRDGPWLPYQELWKNANMRVMPKNSENTDE